MADCIHFHLLADNLRISVAYCQTILNSAAAGDDVVAVVITVTQRQPSKGLTSFWYMVLFNMLGMVSY